MKSAVYPIAFILLSMSAVSIPADAATARTSFSVSVTVLPFCAASASPMRFGTNTGAASKATSNVSVNCNDTTLTPYSVATSAGLAPAAAVASRLMVAPGSALLGTSDPSGARGIINLGRGVTTMAETANGTVQTVTVDGQIPAAQAAKGGTYADTVTVTITY